MTILAYDSFRRLDNSGLDIAWSGQVGSGGSGNDNWKIDGTNQRIKPFGFASDWVNLFTGGVGWPNNQYAKATISSISGNAAGSGGGLVVRGAVTAETGYYVYVNDAAGNDTYIVKRLNGAVTTLSTTDNGWAVNDTIYLEISGTNITVKKNGVQVATASDSDIASGCPGVAYSSTITDFSLDNFEAGNLLTDTSSLSSLATDNFNRADSVGLGGNWSSVAGTTLPDVVSNQASTAADPAAARYTAITWPADQYSQMKITGTLTTNASDGAAVAVRMDSGGVRSFYFFRLNGSTLLGASSGGVLGKWINGVQTDLGYFSEGTTGDTIYLSIVNNVLTVKINGTTHFIVTDNTFTSGQAGIAADGTPDTITLDDWEGGGQYKRSWILTR